MKSYLALTWKELKAVSYTHLDDELQGESNSISNQKKMLEDYARRNGLPNPTHFTDDGVSGTRFDRPGFLAMMEEVEAEMCIRDSVYTVLNGDCLK